MNPNKCTQDALTGLSMSDTTCSFLGLQTLVRCPMYDYSYDHNYYDEEDDFYYVVAIRTLINYK